MSNAKAAAALAVLGMLAVTASPAAASTTVGSPNLGSPSTDALICSAPPCQLVMDKVDGGDVYTPEGVVTSWSVRRANGSIQLLAVRPRGAFVADELHGTIFDATAGQTGNGSDTVLTAAARMPVANGDYIAAAVPTGGSIGYLAGSPGDQIFETNGTNSARDVDSTTPDNFELLISATVEPDADGDRYGDETQDGCPSDPYTQGACPVVTPPQAGSAFVPPVSTAATTKVALASRSATFKGGKASIALTNPNAVAVTVKLALKLGKKVVGSEAAGSRSYALAAGATRTIKVKLAKAARKRIAKHGKVKLSLSLTAKGATGATFKTAAILTVKKAAKKKAKKKKKPAQEKQGGGNALDGKYAKDPASGPDLRFTVTGAGRKIENLTGSIGGYCSVYVFGGGIKSELRTLFPGIESMAVAADGSFSGSQKLSDTTTEITNGKLAGGIATGTVKVTSPGCTSGAVAFTSRRTGP